MDVNPSQTRSARSTGGLTLPELMAVVAIAAVVSALALPSFSALLEQGRQTSHLNTLIASLHLARSEAAKRGGQVVVCKSADGASCDSSLQWHDGWIVFADGDENRVRALTEPIFQHQPPLTGANLRFSAFIGAGNYVVYRPTGFSLTNGTFTYCDRRGAPEARAVVISLSGRVRVDTVTAGGEALTCP